ncbi:MAG TPA: hypothetical protein VMW24_25990 [Sedimentisphaerales bacterium]|nr:hypothetical protein [Sedimentisphaerales bacterium]
MNTKRFVKRAMLLLVVTTSIISGCTVNRIDLVEAGMLTLEPHAAGKVGIAWSSAYKDKEGFVIAGVLTRHDHVGLPIRAHVDITVLSPDGRTLNDSRTPDICVPAHVTGRGQSLKRFEVRFPHLPPQGSSVRMVCHSEPH